LKLSKLKTHDFIKSEFSANIYSKLFNSSLRLIASAGLFDAQLGEHVLSLHTWLWLRVRRTLILKQTVLLS